MKRSTKRLVSLLICLAMALAILPVAAFAAGTTTVYCQAPKNWTVCYAYWWGSSGANPSWSGNPMSKNSDGIWTIDVPSDAVGLIFNNGSVQSADLKVPTDDKVMFYYSGGSWTTYGLIEEEDLGPGYYVAGTDKLCGVSWQPGAIQNRMTESGGVYTKTYTNVPAGNYEFKVTDGTWDQSWGKDAGNDNYALSLTEATNTVEIRFDPAVPSVEVIINGAGHEAPPPVDNGIYFVAGSFNDWNAAADGYQMIGDGNGIYNYILGLDAGDYELKITDGTWDQSWGADTASGNYEFNVAADDSVVTVTFDWTTEEISVVVTAPGSDSDETLIAEGTAAFASGADAWDNPASFEFVPAADGTVTIEITDCDPGFWVEFYIDEELIEEYQGYAAEVIEISVTAGVVYSFDITTGSNFDTLPEKVAGSVTYKITADVVAGEPSQGEDDQPGTGGETSEENPQPIISPYGNFIDAGQTMWFVFDDYNDMMNNGIYSQMLHISAGVPYTVTYRGENVPVDVADESTVYFVNYEMMDLVKQGKYVFSVTNNGSSRAYFTISVDDRPTYVISEYALALGDNMVIPDPEVANTLYEFAPDEPGIYTFTISEGVIGNWGIKFNPQDNTGTKDKVLQWTCSAKGQGVMIGVAQTEEAVLTVEKTGAYVAEEQVDETVYKNTYGFDYQLPENPDLVAIDVLDGKKHEAVLDKNGFYRYGSQYGPLMVTDLNKFPVNLVDAYTNGQLKAYVYEGGNLIARYNYNEAMNEYLEAGLVPVTEELARMLKQMGDHHNWWCAEGFVFEGEAPEDASTAWMVACSWIKGSELTPDVEDNGSQGGNNQGGNNQGGNNQGGSSGNQSNTGSNPKTTDISMAWAMIAMIMAGTCLVVLKKKETFFVG